MPTASGETEAEPRPLGLRFVVDALNNPPATGNELRLLARDHGADVVPSDFRAEEFLRATDAVRRTFTATGDREASEAINAILADVRVPTELDRLADGRWVLRPSVGPDAPAAWFAATAAFGLGLWMTERGHAAWGICAADDCARAYIDAGRRSPQQYCSPRCATRVRVAAHRESARAQRRSTARPELP